GMKSGRFHLVRGLRSAYLDLGNQLTDGNELRFASHQAANFLERRLFFRTESMRILAGLKEPLMGAAKFVTSGISCDQAKAFIEFVVDTAARWRDAFHHREPHAAALDCRLGGYVELE